MASEDIVPYFTAALENIIPLDSENIKLYWILDYNKDIYDHFVEKLTSPPILPFMSYPKEEDIPKDLVGNARNIYCRENTRRNPGCRGRHVIEMASGSYSKMCTVVNSFLKICEKRKIKTSLVLAIRILRCDKIDPTFWSGLVNISNGILQGAGSCPYPKIDPPLILVFGITKINKDFIRDLDFFFLCDESEDPIHSKEFFKSGYEIFRYMK